LFSCSAADTCKEETTAGYYLNAEVQELYKCTGSGSCELISSPLDGYYINKDDGASASANQVITCNDGNCSVVTVTPTTCGENDIGKVIYNSGVKICLAASDADPKVIPQVGSDLYKAITVNEFPHVTSGKTVIVKIGTDGSATIEDGYYLKTADILTAVDSVTPANNEGTHLYTCTSNDCTSAAVAGATAGYYINAANKKNLILCDGSNKCELVTPAVGYYKTIDGAGNKYVQCTGKADGCEEVVGSGTCTGGTNGLLNASSELCLSGTTTEATAAFSTGAFLLEGSAATGIFYEILSSGADKALLKVTSNAITIDKTSGKYYVNKTTLATTDPDCDEVDPYNCNSSGICVKDQTGGNL